MDQLRDNEKYAAILARVYKCLFERGSSVFRKIFDYHSISRIAFKEPENTGSGASKWAAYCAAAECQRPVGYPERYKYSPKLLNVSTQAFVNTVFGTAVNVSEFRYQSRSYLINNLFLEIFDNRKQYDTCEDYIILNFPLHTTKLMVDNIKRNWTVFQQLKDEYFTMVNLLLDEAKKFVRENKVMEKEAIEVLGDLLDQNKFLFVDHPIFDDENFERYTRDVLVELPQASRLVNSYRPILNYEREHGGKHVRLMTQVLNAMHTKTNQLNSFDFGIFLYPLYDVNWPPTLTLSGMGFVIAHEIGHTFLKAQNLSTSLYENYECIKKLYEGQCSPREPDFCIDPGMTYEENLADQIVYRRNNEHTFAAPTASLK
uniref:Peptidase_M13 domain-containing protein n=1 Tax=Bursaphelenchus xylophilus TaxID=6326 RepID=A0A1I7SGK0_BURXY